jgi:hypothetical protein
MKTATILKKLRADPGVLEARIVGDKVKVRMRKRAGSDAHDRVSLILFGSAPTLRQLDMLPAMTDPTANQPTR